MLSDAFKRRKREDEEDIRELRRRMVETPDFINHMREFCQKVTDARPDDENLYFLVKQIRRTCDVLENCQQDLEAATNLCAMYLHLNYENCETLERIIRPRAQEGRHTQREWEMLVILCGEKCVLCGIPRSDLVSGILTKDHIVSQRFDERTSDHITNLQPMCQRCNSRKRFIFKLEGVDLVPFSVRQIMQGKLGL